MISHQPMLSKNQPIGSRGAENHLSQSLQPLQHACHRNKSRNVTFGTAVSKHLHDLKSTFLQADGIPLIMYTFAVGDFMLLILVQVVHASLPKRSPQPIPFMVYLRLVPPSHHLASPQNHGCVSHTNQHSYCLAKPHRSSPKL